MPRALALFLSLGTSACGLILPGSEGEEQSAEDSAQPAEDVYIAVGDEGAVMSSPDGVTWTVRTSGVSVALHAAAWGDDHYIAVGQAGKILVSTDGAAWSGASSPSSRDLHAVVYHGDRFFAVGGDASAGAETLVSDDGTTWTRPEITAPKHVLMDLASDGVNLVAIGNYDASLQTFGLFTWSEGNGWLQQVDGGSVARYNAVAAGSPAFVAIGTAAAMTSADSVTWKPTLPLFGANQMNDLMYASGWIAVGLAGQTLTSYDGLQWTPHAGPVAQHLHGVTTGGGLYIAVGDAGTIVSSGDGATWTPQTSPLAVNLRAVTHPGA